MKFLKRKNYLQKIGIHPVADRPQKGVLPQKLATRGVRIVNLFLAGPVVWPNLHNDSCEKL